MPPSHTNSMPMASITQLLQCTQVYTIILLFICIAGCLMVTSTLRSVFFCCYFLTQVLSVNFLSGNFEHYSGRLLCTENGNPEWDLERSYSSFPAICAARCQMCQSLMHVQNRQRTMSVVLSISRSQWSVATDKILFPSIRLSDVICVELVYQHHKLQCIQLHRLTTAIGAAAVLWVQVQWEYTVERSSVHLNVIRRMSRWTRHGRYMYRF